MFSRCGICYLPGNLNIKMPEIFSTYYYSPIGMLKISGTAYCIHEVLFWQSEIKPMAFEPTQHAPAILQQCVEELIEYFEGQRRSFEVPFQQDGTEFQKRVWNELLMVPYGNTISYLELSKRIGDVKAIRAAASTNGKNKIAVIVPCHRVIGSNRELVGYGGGLYNKKWLLQHESKIAHGVQTLF